MDIDLVLSGSGVKLGAHVGAIAALEELDYRAVRIAGSSGGAIVGGFYAAGYNPKEMHQVMARTDFQKLKKFSPVTLLKDWGIYSNAPLKKYLHGLLGEVKFKDLKRELHVCVSDVLRNGTIVLNAETAPELEVAEAITMSATIPLFYGKMTYRDWTVVDGGLTNGYPIDLFDNSREVVGIRIQGKSPIYLNTNLNFFRYVRRIVSTMLEALNREHIEDAAWAKTIPVRIDSISSVEFDLTSDQKEFLFNAGHRAVMEWHNKK